MNKLLLIYYLILNVLLFVFMGTDKYLAQKNKTRIPERWLFIISLLGGGLGGFLGLKAFKHKSRKAPFVIVFILSIIIHIFIILCLKGIIKISL